MAVEEKTAAQQLAEHREKEARRFLASVYADSVTNGDAAQAATAHALLAISHRLADLTEAVRESMDLTIYDGSEENRP